MVTPEHFADVVKRRRTHLLVDPDRTIDDDTIHDLCALATWAPNHKQTWPWRFASFTGEGRRRLGESFVADMEADGIGDDVKRAKTLVKYLRAPNIVVVACSSHPHPTFHDENRDAVAAGIQNLLLGATARGLASFWSTAPVMSGAHAAELCGFATDDRVIGVIYLGYPRAALDPPERPPPAIRFVSSASS